MEGLAVDIVMAVLLLLAALSGTKRGAVFIGLELGCFALATAGGFWLYRPAGAAVKAFGPNSALANVIAFTAIWIVIELAAAIFLRFVVIHRIPREVQLAPLNQVGGAFLNVLKTALLMGLALMVISALPLSPAAKSAVTSSWLARNILSSTARVQAWSGGSIGQDLSDTFNSFTIISTPESSKRVDLGFTTTGAIDQAAEAQMLTLVNQERTSRGLTALTLNEKARNVARAYSQRMFQQGYFSHIDNDGHNPFQRLTAGGVQFLAAGENLALAPTLTAAHQGLMNSPGHRANILSTSYHKVGIGIIDGGKYGLMVTQEFID